jgi:beta-lactamase superfamily II metal-dependent hydrolase
MFQIEMLPAREGDCLLLTYGQQGHERRVLIDGGRAATYDDLKTRLSRLTDREREFELLIVTHVDRDHIEGALKLLEDKSRPVEFRDIWFNGFDHLQNVKLETFGAVQGEKLTTAIITQRLPWNKRFGGRAVEIDPAFTPVELEGGLKLTVLSPNRKKLEALIPQWIKECEDAELIPGARPVPPPETPAGFEAFGARVNIETLAAEKFEYDNSKANGSSIALLAEYDGKRVLLAGDAHADLLEDSLQSLAASGGGRLRLDAMKVSHHGSAHNTSQRVLDLITCTTYLVSTNGSTFRHPDKTAIARLISFGGAAKEIVFNYNTNETLVWNNRTWMRKHGYMTRYPSANENGFNVLNL